MKRVDIYYGGQHYSVSDREPEDVMAEIAAGVASETPVWMTFNIGEGTVRPASVLLSPGVHIAVVPQPDSLP